MRHPDYDKAFHDTPDYIRSAIELGMRKGEQKMKMRQKFMSALAVAAGFAVILGAAALGASRLAAPKPDNRVASQPRATAAAEGTGGAAAVLVTPDDTATPDPTPEITPTLEVTPEPTPAPTSESEFPEAVYYTQGGRYFHIERECSGLENGIEGSVSDAYHAGKEPCPICLAGWSFEVNAVPEITPDPTPLPAVEAEEESADAEPAAEIEVEEAFEYAYLGLSPEDPAYYAPDDNHFHFKADCPELEGRITVAATLGAAMRDHMVCEKCKPMEATVVYNPKEGVMRSAATGDILVYYNPNGTYFHVDFDCSGMLGAQLHTLQEAVEAGKVHCPVCIGDNEKLYRLDVRTEDDGYEPAT